MAFNFFGVFSVSQWECFKAFARIQRLDLQIRKEFLEKQRLMMGIFTTEYDGHMPSSFTVNPGSYASKLLEAYKILGGNLERELLLRTMDKPVFLTRGSNFSVDKNATIQGGYSDRYSNGRVNRGDQRFDRDLGLKVDKLKKWQLEIIKSKRERLEYKIKRALDYSDQLQSEINLINKALSAGLGGFDDQLISIDLESHKPGTSNLVDDIEDLFGLFIGKPADLSFSDAISIGDQENQRGLT